MQKKWDEDTITVPPIKWAGGKRWLVSHYPNIFPKKYNTYYEPFLGSGAVFFYLKPEKSVLSDLNAELIEFYQTLQKSPFALQRKLMDHQSFHSEEYYDLIRKSYPKKRVDRSARFLYLNRSCWNGLYRVNKKGEFNVPIGNRTNFQLKTDDYRLVSNLLKNAELNISDFEETIDLAHRDDFIFVDPPYTVMHNENGFVKYNQKIFSWDDQIRLKKCLDRAKERGAKILITNAAHRSIKQLYSEHFYIKKLNRLTNLSANSSSRGITEEYIISSYKIEV
ncbi:Dam family site-specific DNA-(adenine-N6)-methyltransferase [Leptospira levettii]|uniref:DNA adenine methylase n=1 Tax=Leptospira levettii TaxID=2023178 RepID=UPI001EEC0AD7|nr:Dam family site-specific DNA-(adenine-N6)-methyltransferase [Leptospira levettii]MCG6150236.1 Dam family site-specific DNA-(adenine-N6)-methyltransferase [Leptospira levettii]